MRRVIALSAVLTLTVLLGVGPDAYGQKGKKEKDADTEGKNSEKMMKSGVVLGKVLNVYEDKRRLRLQVKIPVAKPDAGAVQRLAQARIDLARATDANGRLNAQIAMAKAQAEMVKVEYVNREVEVQAIDEVIVRLANPKQTFDEKGRLKTKYSKAELKEMKGDDPKLPGYKAEFSDVQTEQIVRVTMVKKKGEPKEKAPPKKKGKKDDDMPADGLLESMIQVSLIEIMREPPPSK